MTKKFAVAAKPDGAEIRNREFVIPGIEEADGSGFVGLKSGRAYTVATVVYSGEELSVEKVLDSARIELPKGIRFETVIQTYLDELAAKKIGDTITASVSVDGQVKLTRKQAKSRVSTGAPKLP